MKKKLIGILASLVYISSGNATHLTTSVIVPCSHKHAHLLYDLCKEYEKQTVLPDEIVISMSGCKQIHPDIIPALERGPWAFPVRLHTFDEMYFADQNRNIGCSHAKGDIFILQDADDIPHPQRVEIVRYCFEQLQADHVMHSYFAVTSNKEPINFTRRNDLKKIPIWFPKNIEDVQKLNTYTNGNIAIRRHVFATCTWPRRSKAEDAIFNGSVHRLFKKLIAVDMPLICYRKYLSTWL